MKKITVFLFILFYVAISASAQSSREDLKEFQKFTQFYNYLTSTYIDTLNTSEIVEDAIKQILSELDPHSAYISAEEMKNVEESFGANFEGIGVEFNILRDTVFIVNTIVGGPAEKVGILPNDRIVTIEGDGIVGIKNTDVPKLLKGPRGTSVEVGIVRRGIDSVMTFRIVRDKIPINTIDASYRIDDSIGYIKMNRFAASTDSELSESLRSMEGITSLILDLRGNGGGFMDQAVEVSNHFLERGSLVVWMEGRAVNRQDLLARKNPQFLHGKLIILVDEFSASSSEIVAGAIQDWDRGLIIGRRTFGKGTIQRQFVMVDGSAVRITIARYHTPSGRVIQRPYERGDNQNYYADFRRRLYSYEEEVQTDSMEFYTLRSRRVVYGGGGITPDITVQRDTTYFSDYRALLIRNGIINQFTINYIDNNREQLLGKYADFESFERNFIVDEQMTDELIEFGKSRGISYDQSGFEKSGSEIKIQIKALIAQKLWNMDEYYRMINKYLDPEFSKAVEVLRNWDRYSDGIFS
ncbi:MAG: S41 family peptidase [Rikenellaceae bacterium]|nr:S41 family peptidase [Rikenellaceae bacterium]